MDDGEDLYAVIGLPPALDGGLTSSAEAIRKAYRSKALICHPDKRPNDPLAAAEFQKLQKAYDILSDEKARKAYDDLIHVRKARLEKESRADSKRRKMMEDLRRRESAAEAVSKEKDEEERAFKRLQEEIARIRANRGQKTMPFETATHEARAKATHRAEANKENMMKVSWLSADSGGSDYSAIRIKDIFSQFGKVEDVVIRSKSTKKLSSALVVMSSRDEVIVASKCQCGDVSNPILVVPLVPDIANQPVQPSSVKKYSSESTSLNTGNIVGSSYHDYEDSILQKLRKKAEQLK